MSVASACVISVTGMVTSGGRGGLEQRQVYFVLPEKWIFMGKQPSGVVSENSETGGGWSLGSTAHSGGVDTVIQRQLEKFAPTQQTGGWQ